MRLPGHWRSRLGLWPNQYDICDSRLLLKVFPIGHQGRPQPVFVPFLFLRCHPGSGGSIPPRPLESDRHRLRVFPKRRWQACTFSLWLFRPVNFRESAPDRRSARGPGRYRREFGKLTTSPIVVTPTQVCTCARLNRRSRAATVSATSASANGPRQFISRPSMITMIQNFPSISIGLMSICVVMVGNISGSDRAPKFLVLGGDSLGLCQPFNPARRGRRSCVRLTARRFPWPSRQHRTREPHGQNPARPEIHQRLPLQASFNGSGLILTYLVVLAIEACPISLLNRQASMPPLACIVPVV